MRRCACQRLFPTSIFPSPTQRVVLPAVRLGPNTPSLRTRPSSYFPSDPISQRRNFHSTRPRAQSLQASSSPYLLFLGVVCGSAILIDYIVRNNVRGARDNDESDTEHCVSDKPAQNTYDSFYTDMPIPPGHLGNLTPEQEAKLQDLWTATLRVFGIEDPHHVSGTDTPLAEEESIVTEADGKDKKKSKRRLGVFKRKDDKKDSSNGSATPTKADSDDKYGQVKDFHEIVATQDPEMLRATFWSMVKADHPDALLLRFLRARKWDVDKALVMLISTMRWRSHEQHVDDDVILRGEGGALEDSKSSDLAVKKEGNDFLTQLRLGKSFLHGTDKEGRPLCFVRVRLHKGGEQSERSLERYTVYVIETARLALRAPVETACIVFDMSHFTMANMDYTPVKFMIKIFEANYPESLGAVLVHKSPWIFQGIWKIIRGWLDPVVAGKVHFTSDVADLEKFIPKSQIIKELDGDEDWEYKYVEPVPGENDAMNEEGPRKELEAARDVEVREYEKKTFDWVATGTDAEAGKIKEERNSLARHLNENYWELDKYVRARTLYDRTGMISQDGKINFYPPPPGKAENHHLAPTSNPPTVETSADDLD
ncbi:phosphatidylinositol transfer protein csr1 [Exophiala xenobiotica]|nr:phosphatidylinositol transfer protein csr1 [Exophiala xenobiotica]KAK5367458.1 phosphatidylinositol transfer protein csr1 [Exophiala xenobiotica]KAK5369116.1 phosphatidylinositol transfer protein csr1 [Exophiala xenobiotica]